MAKESDAGGFEASLEELEKLVRQLESGDLPLEKSIACYEAGMKLVKSCRKQLEDAERRIAVLAEGEHGDLKLQDAKDADEGNDDLPF